MLGCDCKSRAYSTALAVGPFQFDRALGPLVDVDPVPTPPLGTVDSRYYMAFPGEVGGPMPIGVGTTDPNGCMLPPPRLGAPPSKSTALAALKQVLPGLRTPQDEYRRRVESTHKRFAQRGALQRHPAATAAGVSGLGAAAAIPGSPTAALQATAQSLLTAAINQINAFQASIGAAPFTFAQEQAIEASFTSSADAQLSSNQAYLNWWIPQALQQIRLAWYKTPGYLLTKGQTYSVYSQGGDATTGALSATQLATQQANQAAAAAALQANQTAALNAMYGTATPPTSLVDANGNPILLDSDGNPIVSTATAVPATTGTSWFDGTTTIGTWTISNTELAGGVAIGAIALYLIFRKKR